MFLWSVTIISHKDCCCSVTQLAHQTSLSLNISQNVPNFLSIALVMSSSHLIFWHPLFLMPSIFPNIRDFSNESAVHIRWPRVSASALILLLSIQSWFPLRLTGLIFLLPKGLSKVFYSTTVQKHQFLGILPSLQSISHNSMWPLERIALITHNFREGDGTPLQYSCLENPMDGGAWWAAVRGVVKSRTRLSDFTFTFHFHALEKEMATHSIILAWRIPRTEEPGGLPSVGSHRVRHDWSDLAAAAL